MKFKKKIFNSLINEKDLNMWVIDNISSIEHEVKRIFFINSKIDTIRGKHAHKNCWQTLVNIMGNLKISVDDGHEIFEINLENHGEAVTIPPMYWCTQTYSEDTYLMVFCSKSYDENDYIRDYEEFKKLLKK